MLVHKGTLPLETGRLILRRFKPNDAEYMFKNWATDYEVSKFLSWNPHKDLNETKRIVDSWLNDYVKNNCYNWAIELKDFGNIIGQICVVSLSEKYYSCEVEYSLGRLFWGKGIMTEALKAVIGYLFNEIGMNRIEAKHNTLNPASGKVMQKSGMKHEGILRQVQVDKNGHYNDLAVYSILKSEYDTIK